jgi:PAS domain S-box-containing protein
MPSSARVQTTTPRKRRARHLLVPLAVLAAIILSRPTAAAPTKEARRILILNEVGAYYPATDIIKRGIQTALDNSPYRLEFYAEYFDTILFPDPAAQQEFREFYIHKYQNRKPDVIITVGPSPLQFMEEAHQRVFPGVPIVFCLPSGSVPGAPALDSDFTGVENDMAPAETLEVALRLQPGTEHVYVVGGVSNFDKKQLAAVKQQLKVFADQIDIKYLTNLAMPDLLESLRHLPHHTIVLLTTIGQDAAGTPFKSSETGPMVAAAANAPVFTLFDVYLNHGEVGGYLSSLSEQGKVAGAIALRMLRGEKPWEIPKVKRVNAYMFDWHALRRWGLHERDLPAGSIVINRPPDFWQTYRLYVLAGISLLLAQMAAILGLLWQRARRRKTEAALRSSEEKFSTSFRQSPLSITLAGTKDGRYLEVNETFVDQTGWKRDEVVGRSPLELGVWIDSNQRSQFMKQVLAEGSVRDWELKIRRKDGQIRTVLGSAGLVHVSGEPCALSVFADITERKQAEEALATLSGRLIDAQEEERKRIAREIHDDYNQRLAVLANDLEELAERVGDSPVAASQRLHQLWNGISEIAADLHHLSHNLHPSTLENLGLVAGVKAFCQEFADQQQMQVQFAHENVPRAIPADVALCLFRVTQEALRNIKRHSGTNRAEVRLEGLEEKLHLSIADHGRGFDVNKCSPQRGIGIRSMEERLRFMGGHLEVHSRPMEGTRIDAWVLFKAARRLAS